MKKITNNRFKRFCDVIQRSLYDKSVYDECISDMISASEDDNNNFHVYTDTDHNMQALKLDEYSKDFNKKRRAQIKDLKVDFQPSAVDAVCVNKDNEWFLIEFKNQPLNEAVSGSTKKMLSSIWLIAFLYSDLSASISEETDILRFAREHITFITVVSSEKNEDLEEAIGANWEEDGSFYTPQKFLRYKGYYFKDVYVLTEKSLRSFIEKFDT